MRRLLILIFSALAIDSNRLLAEPASSKPNIIYVLFDDMGYAEPACYRADSKLKTPNMDRLAAAGMRFTDAHSPSAVCTPTRYGLLTGRYPSRIGQYGVLTSYSPPIIPESRLTIASFLKQQGYDTACIGKWHLGLTWDLKTKTNASPPLGARITSGPNQLGFDEFYGFTHARDIGTIIDQNRVVEYVKPEENQPKMIARAVEWLENRDPRKPFFLYFPMCPPHTPIVPSAHYQGKSGAIDEVKKDPKYGDWVFQGDDMLGQLLDVIERKGFSENTIIIATADNGAADRQYTPLRGQKTSIYEGGHRVPFIVRWPAKVKAGSVSDQTICHNDLMATCAEILGMQLPENSSEDSVSILPALLGTDTKPLREATLHQSARGDLALRKGPWKLIILTNGTRELYHLGDDIGETKDLAAKKPEVVVELEALIKRYASQGRSTPGAHQPSNENQMFPQRHSGRKVKPKRQ